MTFEDGSLTADEVGTLCLLAFLCDSEQSYQEVAGKTHAFIHEHSAPSLDLLGHSIEILRLEGLINAASDLDMHQKLLSLTDRGHEMFRKLMLSPVSPPLNDIDRLSLSLKIKFAHLLNPADKITLKEILSDYYAKQRTQYQNLLNNYKRSDKEALYVAWVQEKINHIENVKNILTKILQ